MFKIIKTPIISGSETSQTIGVNSNYKITMGYNPTTKVISVDVQVAKKQDLNRDETLLPTTFEDVASREFTAADFPKSSDHTGWFVDYDVTTNTITDPVETLKWSSQQPRRNSTYHMGQMQSDFLNRYSDKLIPLFMIKCFDKQSVDFEACVLSFWFHETEGGHPADTVITNSDAEVMTVQEKHAYLGSNIVPEVTFKVFDSNGVEVTAPLTKVARSQYKVTLPVSNSYTVKHIFSKPNFGDVLNVYNIEVVNGTANKTRIVVGDGESNVLLNTSGLSAGDFTKVKTHIGDFFGFSELWITYE